MQEYMQFPCQCENTELAINPCIKRTKLHEKGQPPFKTAQKGAVFNEASGTLFGDFVGICRKEATCFLKPGFTFVKAKDAKVIFGAAIQLVDLPPILFLFHQIEGRFSRETSLCSSCNLLRRLPIFCLYSESRNPSTHRPDPI